MAIVNERFSISTQGECDVVDITAEVQKRVEASGYRRGAVTVHIPGSTGAVTTMEFEPGLVADFRAAIERMVPKDIPYAHDARWRDNNGYAHVRAAMLGPSLTVPVADGRLVLGTWQQIVVVDFDNRARSRTVYVQIIGE